MSFLSRSAAFSTALSTAYDIGNRLSAAGGGGFSPGDLGNLALWLDASDVSTIGAVSQWDDKSGNDNHATQGVGANQPVTGIRTQNSLNVIDFDGSSQYLELPSGVYGIPNAENTIYIVYASDDDTRGSQRLVSMTESGGTRYYIEADLDNDRLRMINNTTFSAVIVSAADDTNPHIVGFSFNGTDTLSPFVDGTDYTSGSGAAESGIDAATIGARASGSELLDGIICEICIFTEAHDSTKKSQMFSYFTAKWGLS